MTTTRKPNSPLIPNDEIARLYVLGFSLIPLGGGRDGKSPLVKFAGKPRLPLNRVLAPMHRAGSTCYGILLDGLAVVDCDDDSPSLVQEMEERFGVSPVHVRTARGHHLYYRSTDRSIPNLRAEGLLVDIKRGPSSYIVGPGSVRSDGGHYIPVEGTLGTNELPELRLLVRTEANSIRVAKNRGSNRTQDGSRNNFLTTNAIKMVEYVINQDELVSNLNYIRDEECEHPETVSDAEVEKIAAWAWSKRLENKVYHGRNSEFRVHREALDALRPLPKASDAIALLVTLQDQHGHIPARTFPLQWEKMKCAGYTDLSRDRFYKARNALESVGLLEVATKHRAGNKPRTYRLKRLRTSLTENVSELHVAKGEGGRKEGV